MTREQFKMAAAVIEEMSRVEKTMARLRNLVKEQYESAVPDDLWLKHRDEKIECLSSRLFDLAADLEAI